ncbi:unnamed protein product [Lathyrus oleraceus]|uniref:Uncharacterized protein n=1 Tax=Pisum sativum TaxID=3888 RepID=A0A9D5BH65_PEA|nr:uncharacterized protein LOC127125280 [Pisum sativum]KAI5443593.1 hypothetical protein KIW84_012295 [Pisum sativum]
MVFCDYCLKNVTGEIIDDGYLCCGDCGKVLEDHRFSQKTVFCDHCCENVSRIRLDDGPLFCGDCGLLLEDSVLVGESRRARTVAKKVDDYISSECRFFHRNIERWECENREYLEELAAKEKIAKKAFESFFRNCSNDSLAARDKLAQSAVESLAKSRKEQAQTRENLKKVASENDNISESKSKEMGSFDEFKHTSYQENGGRKKRQRRFAPRICK